MFGFLVHLQNTSRGRSILDSSAHRGLCSTILRYLWRGQCSVITFLLFTSHIIYNTTYCVVFRNKYESRNEFNAMRSLQIITFRDAILFSFVFLTNFFYCHWTCSRFMTTIVFARLI